MEALSRPCWIDDNWLASRHRCSSAATRNILSPFVKSEATGWGDTAKKEAVRNGKKRKKRVKAVWSQKRKNGITPCCWVDKLTKELLERSCSRGVLQNYKSSRFKAPWMKGLTPRVPILVGWYGALSRIQQTYFAGIRTIYAKRHIFHE